MAADHLFELDADVLGLATELEGHPDNVAAAVHGGFVICADGEAARFDPPAGLEAVVVVPRSAVRTKTARAALPAEVPMADAVFNTAHGALLVLGLATATGTSSPAASTTACTSRAASTSTRARWSSCAARARSARSARPSRAPARPSSCGASSTRPRAS